MAAARRRLPTASAARSPRASEVVDRVIDSKYYFYLRSQWERNIFTNQTDFTNFNTFWDKSLHDGIIEVAGAAAGNGAASFAGNAGAAKQALLADQPGDGPAVAEPDGQREAADRVVRRFPQRAVYRDCEQLTVMLPEQNS